MSLCCRDLTQQHRRLAEIVEMIHTASLVHDDVLDESSVRRGQASCLRKSPVHDVCFCWSPPYRMQFDIILLWHAGAPTVNRKFGTKVAVLVGDFLFAQSSWFLAQLDNLEVGFYSCLLSARRLCNLEFISCAVCSTFYLCITLSAALVHVSCEGSCAGHQADQSGYCGFCQR